MSSCVSLSAHCLVLGIKTELEVPFYKMLLVVETNFFKLEKYSFFFLLIDNIGIFVNGKSKLMMNVII